MAGGMGREGHFIPCEHNEKGTGSSYVSVLRAEGMGGKEEESWD
jgi:hypothetical protein